MFFLRERICLYEFLVVYGNYLRDREKARNFIHIESFFFQRSALLLYIRLHYNITRNILQYFTKNILTYFINKSPSDFNLTGIIVNREIR